MAYVLDPTCPALIIGRSVQYQALVPDMRPPIEIDAHEDITVSDLAAGELKLTKLSVNVHDDVHVVDEPLLPLRINVFDRITITESVALVSPQLVIFVFDEVHVSESPLYPYPGGVAPTIPNLTAVYTDFWAVGPRQDE